MGLKAIERGKGSWWWKPALLPITTGAKWKGRPGALQLSFGRFSFSLQSRCNQILWLGVSFGQCCFSGDLHSQGCRLVSTCKYFTYCSTCIQTFTLTIMMNNFTPINNFRYELLEHRISRRSRPHAVLGLQQKNAAVACLQILKRLRLRITLQEWVSESVSHQVNKCRTCVRHKNGNTMDPKISCQKSTLPPF